MVGFSRRARREGTVVVRGDVVEVRGEREERRGGGGVGVGGGEGSVEGAREREGAEQSEEEKRSEGGRVQLESSSSIQRGRRG